MWTQFSHGRPMQAIAVKGSGTRPGTSAKALPLPLQTLRRREAEDLPHGRGQARRHCPLPLQELRNSDSLGGEAARIHAGGCARKHGAGVKRRLYHSCDGGNKRKGIVAAPSRRRALEHHSPILPWRVPSLICFLILVDFYICLVDFG